VGCVVYRVVIEFLKTKLFIFTGDQGFIEDITLIRRTLCMEDSVLPPPTDPQP